MSSLLALFYWVLIPVFAAVVGGKIVVATWSQTTSLLGRSAIVFVTFVGVLELVWLLGGGKKWPLDAEVKRLCAIDGGIRVYGQVALARSEFDQFGDPKFWYGDHKSKSEMTGDTTTIERPLGPDHILKWEVKHIKRRNPSMYRSQENIIRRVDAKNMGE